MALKPTIYRLLLRKDVSVFVVAFLAFGGCALVALVTGIADPKVQDEFSYPLAADTFAHGRLTNRTHPMWMHFESMHVVHQPTYMSKYQPGQGLLLALGQVIGGQPIIGVWAGMAFMAAAICWMLHGWVSARWALVGGVLTVIHPYVGVSSYWAQSYWGGALAAGGGALLLGGVRLLARKPRVRYALATGLGLVILANTRPYEGLVLAIPLGLRLLIFLLGKNRPPLRIAVTKIVLPLFVVGVGAVAWMGWYNYRITGDFLSLPYTVHERQYGMFAYFVWQDLPSAPDYRHPEIRDYHRGYELPRYYEKRSLTGFVVVNGWILSVYWLLVGNVFLISMLGSTRWFFTWCWRNPWGRLAVLTHGFFSAGVMLETVMTLHYWAPITALTFVFIVQSMRMWRAHNPRVGRIALSVIPCLALVVTVLGINASQASRDELASHRQRAKLLEQLRRQEGDHLVLIQYGPKHSYHQEWVYNEADIDGAKVVWARHMDNQKNCQLVDYFKDRVVWTLKIDRDDAPVHLQPFPRRSCDAG